MLVTFKLILIVFAIAVGGAAILFLLMTLIKRVNILKPSMEGTLYETGYLHYGPKSESAGAEVLPVSNLGGDKASIGQVVVKDGMCWVFENHGKSDGRHSLKKVGYVDECGYIFEAKNGEEPKKIGYLAKPSEPNKPTLKGERLAKELWIYKRLKVYLGDPGTVPIPEKKTKPEKKRKKKKEEPKSSPDKVETNIQPVAEEPVKYGDIKEAPSVSNGPDNQIIVDDANIVVVDQDALKDTGGDEVPNNLQKEEPREGDIIVEVTPASVPEPECQEEPESVDSEVEDVVVEPETEQEDMTDGADDAVEVPDGEIMTTEPVTTHTAEEVEVPEEISDSCRAAIDRVISEMIHVDGGTFMMGADAASENTADHKVEQNEGPVHQVTLDSYFIGTYPVTQEIWTAIMGYNPSERQEDPLFPVAPVTWREADEFIKRLSKLSGIAFSLPTEAQWEFAARGGNQSGSYIYAGSNNFNDVGWNEYAVQVGKKNPNELGIYDMSGLVREWTSDWYQDYSAENQYNPHVSEMPEDPELQRMVVRSPAGNCTVTNRKGEFPDTIDFKSYGFRLACEYIPEEKQKKKVPAVLVGQCSIRGFVGGRGSSNVYTDEARGGVAAALCFKKFKAEDETFTNSPYGWLDTALLSSLVFISIYVVLYLINSIIYQLPMYDDASPKWSARFLSLFYFVIWVIVRSIKVAFAEGGNSIQPQLDLFNRSRGVLAFDIALIVLPILCWFDVDFIPCLYAVLFGVILNLLSRKTRTLWPIVNPLVSSVSDTVEFENEEHETLPSPEGDNTIDYEWELDSFDGKKLKATLSMGFYVSYIESIRVKNPFFLEMPHYDYQIYADRMINMLMDNPDMMYRVKYLAQEIIRIAKENDLSELDTVQFALDFIQKPNIDYVVDQNSSPISRAVEYMRFPDETLYDKQGDCDCKSFLAFMLYYAMGYDVLFLLSKELEHAAVAVNLKDPVWKEKMNLSDDEYNSVVLVKNGKEYVYCETTNDNFKVGGITKGERIGQFDKKIELNYEDEE